ncbi:MAG: EAL domain-containing protein [Pseudomonadota bacterium]
MPFRVKIFAAILGAQLLLLIPLATIGIRFIEDTGERIEAHQTVTSANLLVSPIAEPLLFLDHARIDAALRAVVQDPTVISAALLTPEGNILASAGEGGLQPSKWFEDDAIRAQLTEGQTIHIETADQRQQVVPVMSGSELIGVLELRSDNRNVAAAIAPLRPGMILCVLLGLIGAVVLSKLLSDRLSLRLSRLKCATEALGKGEFTSRIEMSGEDEFADLAKAFNEMAESVGVAQSEMEARALHDGLTRLPNRRSFDQAFAKRIKCAQKKDTEACVLIRIDLDHFKQVNDTLGHEAGDAVLLRVAKILKDTLREGDLAARVGGDEFSILMAPDTSEAEAEALVSRIQERLMKPLLYNDRPCRFGASFGVACVPDLNAVGSELNMFADAALYRAKESGRNRLQLFTPSLHQTILRDRQLAIDIQEGLERKEFVPFFQPQFTADTHRLAGAEALLRWNHPSEGLLAPSDFMHIAEILRVVPDIDAQMMAKTCEAVKVWRRQGFTLPKISLNVSTGRVRDPDVVSVARSLAAEDIQVAFELQESILVEEEDELFHFNLDSIRETGVEIVIDDFGSGHASILGLMQIAPSALKIDKRIVAPLCEAPGSDKLVRAIVEIADTLGIATVAEGVESAEQARLLRDLGCDTLQGYHFAKPLSEMDLVSYARFGDRYSA